MNVTIGDRVAGRADVLVGRAAELALFDRILSGELDRNVLLVHGAGGIGKTQLLRAWADAAHDAGRPTRWIDARSIEPKPAAIAAALADVRAGTVVLLDGFERIAAGARELRDDVVPRLPGDAVVVIAGRDRPDAGWFAGGWARVSFALELAALDQAAAVELLGAHGVPAEPAREIGRWAAGSPLALVLAAGAWHRHGRITPEPRLVATLVRLTAAVRWGTTRFDALAACAIARRTTLELLADTLDRRADAESAFGWLAGLPFVDQVGDAVTLHDAVREPMREHLLGGRPARERELRRRIADHLYRLGTLGDRSVLTDLAHLVRKPVLRWTYCWDGSARYHADRIRPGDTEVLGTALTARGYPEWWATSEPYHRLAPRNVVVARDDTGTPVGYAVWLTPGSAPRSVLAGDAFGRDCLDFAARVCASEDVVIWRDSIDLSDDEGAALAMLNIAVALRADVANPRHAIVPLFQHNERLHEFCLAVGGTVVPELDRTVDGRPLCAYWIDYGPGGLRAHQLDQVYRELGLPPALSVGQVRAALESFAVAAELAEHPLAVGIGVEQRAESVRSTLRSGISAAFGTSQREEELRAVLWQRYVEPGATSAATARGLSMSKATYFRRLTEGVRRLTEHLAHATR
ncbi:ATP-binding protein [Actinophytocola gossypii]|uniref:ATP-binding protein n=1 Tax=Actinophytocola gossypii TaxID=2812003 RepID=A0ABT2J907_9PSEU|nr:ATP-binding protein [Actinophytocola gossypii]MCT2584347.1 ATP-binding protein [Actinophytocola gossypii]